MLTQFLKKEIKDKCLQNNNQEICGLLIETPTGVSVHHSQNNAANKSKYFVINPIDYIQASEKGKIIGCYHSHIDDNFDFSEFDKNNAEKHKLTYVLYSIKADKFIEYIPQNRKNNYLDRKFEIGKSDCFSLVRDYYLNEFKIKISDYQRKNGWFDENTEIIFQNFEKEGFRLLENNEKWEKYDILTFGKTERELFHFMIYLDNEIILHHPHDKYSIIEKLSDSKKRHIKAVFRYKIPF